MHDLKLEGPASNALARLQDTELSPMEEALFQAWTKANKIQKPDAPDDHTDYRGIYLSTGGAILPNGELSRITQRVANENALEQALYAQMKMKAQNTIQSVQDKQNQAHKEMRQDMTHQQRMESETMKLRKAPHDAKMKEMDLHKQRMGLDAQRLGNEGKQLDIVSSLTNPQPMGVSSATRSKEPL